MSPPQSLFSLVYLFAVLRRHTKAIIHVSLQGYTSPAAQNTAGMARCQAFRKPIDLEALVATYTPRIG